jgi:hypothetical protein
MTKRRTLITPIIAFCLAAVMASSLPWLARANSPISERFDSGPDLNPEAQALAISPINSLTGLPVADPQVLDRRPLGIKISNHPRDARPQWGLTRADLVYEYYLEYGLTRFFAVFYAEEAERVGPVRSARFFDEQLVRMYQSIFVFANADRRVLDHFMRTDLVSRFVVERPDNCPPMCRDPWKQGYNNLYTDTQGARQYAREERHLDDLKQDLTGLAFDVFPPEGGIAGARVETTYSPYSYNAWQYDTEAGRYLRFQDAEDNLGDGEVLGPLTDSLTGQQVAADNVVILLVPHRSISTSPEIMAMSLSGEGPAYIFRDGLVFRAYWGRATRDSVLTLTWIDGSPVPLKPGKTFFQVIGVTSQVWQFGERWRFEFQIP